MTIGVGDSSLAQGGVLSLAFRHHLNSRYLAKRATIITTNYPDADREKVLAADPLVRREYLVERIGQRLRSRLMERCLVVALDGPDWRRVRQAGHRPYVMEPDARQSRFGGRRNRSGDGSAVTDGGATRLGACSTPRSAGASNASGFR